MTARLRTGPLEVRIRLPKVLGRLQVRIPAGEAVVLQQQKGAAVSCGHIRRDYQHPGPVCALLVALRLLLY